MYTARLGCGVYLTPLMRIALDHAAMDDNGHMFIFLCNALTGHYTVGNTSDKEPPFQDGTTLLRYDSTVDDMSSPTKFAVFSDGQVLVRYLIELSTISTGIFKLLS